MTITDTVLAIPLTDPPPFNHFNGGWCARVGVVFVRTIKYTAGKHTGKAGKCTNTMQEGGREDPQLSAMVR